MISTQQRRRAWLDGVARLFNWRGTLNVTYRLPRQAPSPRAEINRNWVTIGEYFDTVLESKSTRQIMTDQLLQSGDDPEIDDPRVRAEHAEKQAHHVISGPRAFTDPSAPSLARLQEVHPVLPNASSAWRNLSKRMGTHVRTDNLI